MSILTLRILSVLSAQECQREKDLQGKNAFVVSESTSFFPPTFSNHSGATLTSLKSLWSFKVIGRITLHL